MGSDYEVFEGKPLDELFKDIYNNSVNNKKNIQELVGVLAGHIKTTQDAIAIIPSIKEFLDVDVKNDEQLVKLAKVVQQLISHDISGKESETLTGDARQKVLEDMRQVAEKEAKKLDNDNTNLQSQIEDIAKNVQTSPEA